MSIQLDESGQDWRVYLKLVAKGGSPKRDTDVSTGLWRVGSSNLYATPVETLFNKRGEIAVIFPEGAPFLPDSPTELDADCGDIWFKFLTDVWPRCSAVDFDEYEAAKGTGRWADGQATSPRGSMGANNPPEDAAEKLLAEARENLAKATELKEAGAAKSQKAADAAQVLIKTMSTQRADLGEAHKKEKEPHLEAGRAVDRKYLDLVKDMNAIGITLKREVVDPFLRKQEEIAYAAAAAAQKIIDAAAAAAAAAEAEAAATEGDAGEQPPVSDEQWDAAAPPPVSVTVAKVSAGPRGAKASLKDNRSGKVDDYTRFAEAIATARNPELLTLLDAIGHKMARLPGFADKKDGEIIYPGLKMVVTRST